MYVAPLDLTGLYWLGIIYVYRNMFVTCRDFRLLNLIFFNENSHYLFRLVR